MLRYMKSVNVEQKIVHNLPISYWSIALQVFPRTISYFDAPFLSCLPLIGKQIFLCEIKGAFLGFCPVKMQMTLVQ